MDCKKSFTEDVIDVEATLAGVTGKLTGDGIQYRYEDKKRVA